MQVIFANHVLVCVFIIITRYNVLNVRQKGFPQGYKEEEEKTVLKDDNKRRDFYL